MTPRFPVPNQANRRNVYAESLRDIFHWEFSLQGTDFQNFFFVQFVHSVLRTFLRFAGLNDVIAMQLIVSAGYILQIFKTRVGLHAVYVIDLLAFWRRSDKRQHDKPVNLESFYGSPVMQGHARIAVRAKVRSKNATLRVHVSGFAEHVSTITDLVQTLKPRYWFPVFHLGSISL